MNNTNTKNANRPPLQIGTRLSLPNCVGYWTIVVRTGTGLYTIKRESDGKVWERISRDVMRTPSTPCRKL